MTTIAEILIDTLEQAGVKRVYGIVGDSLNGINSALTKKKSIEWVHVRNEEAAAFAAGAEAQVTGELAVCAGSCGPGNLHLINGLFDCHRSGAPVLAIASHIPSVEVGTKYFQETHPNILFQECSCFCEMVTNGAQMPRLLKIAMRTAIAKQGVAVLVISGDVSMDQVESSASAAWVPIEKPVVVPPASVLQDIAKHLNAAKTVSVFAGIGAADAHASLMAVCDKLKAPVVHTLRGKPFIEYDNPYDVGMTGFIGFSSGYYAMESCDTLLLLGASFPYRQFYPTNAKIIQIDINGEQLGKRAEIALGAIGDIDSTLRALLPLLNSKKDTTHLKRAVTHYHKSQKSLAALAKNSSGLKPIHPQVVASLVSKLANDDTVFTCDVGTPTIWCARYLKMNGKRRLLGSFNHGSMANAMAQAIGVQSAFPKRQIIAMCGDGGFAMLMGEVLTLLQNHLPVKIVIFNNGALDFVEMEMHADGILESNTNLKNPNFAKMAEGIGMYGIRIEDPKDLETGLKAAFDHKGPALVDILVNRNELSMPPTITAGEIKGFSLYMLKSVISDHGKELVDILKTNFWR